jgi:hypothetical protein
MTRPLSADWPNSGIKRYAAVAQKAWHEQP